MFVCSKVSRPWKIARQQSLPPLDPTFSYYCVRRRRTHTNHVVFRNQSRGFYEEVPRVSTWCHSISGFRWNRTHFTNLWLLLVLINTLNTVCDVIHHCRKFEISSIPISSIAHFNFHFAAGHSDVSRMQTRRYATSYLCICSNHLQEYARYKFWPIVGPHGTKWFWKVSQLCSLTSLFLLHISFASFIFDW